MDDEDSSNVLQKRGTIEFVFEDFPHSKVTMAPIKGYYFVRAIKWSRRDRAVTRHDLEKFEWPQIKRSARRLLPEKKSIPHPIVTMTDDGIVLMHDLVKRGCIKPCCLVKQISRSHGIFFLKNSISG